MNKTVLSTVLAVFALASTDGFAQGFLNTAPSPGRPHGPWYGSISGGYTMVDDITLSDDSGNKGRIGVNGGYVFAGAIGYKWPKYLRTEFEVSYQSNTLDSVSINGNKTNMSGDSQLLFYSINAYHDIKTDSKFLPYFGGGVGGVHEMLNDMSSGGIKVENRNSDNIELHGEVGLHYDLGRDVSFGPSYRFVHIFDSEGVRDDSNLHQIKVGLRFPFR
ncbi:outer membrane protein [Magnetospirillum molischianum]|uniref:Outer membrane protein beta-barrel domain-containing protein n=1 Tax=Magnetospirillum molischianum DSM 120 TaxID=1150626 RepID=H8FU20_MAGML|nr:outer membrane beta-barrel protein [Magnetospirillum molischianum]CCG41858.1 exported hypothetical protein [Magnetospirillum molischianum DSM 120]